MFLYCVCFELKYSNWISFSSFVDFSQQLGHISGYFPWLIVLQIIISCCSAWYRFSRRIYILVTPGRGDNQREFCNHDLAFFFFLFKSQCKVKANFVINELIEYVFLCLFCLMKSMECMWCFFKNFCTYCIKRLILLSYLHGLKMGIQRCGVESWHPFLFEQCDVNPLHPDISMNFLHTVLCTLSKVPTERICLTIKRFFRWLSYSLFSWSCCLI